MHFLPFPKLAAATLVPLAFATIQPSAVHAEDLESFAILAGSTVTNTGPSVINGNIGVSPGTAIVGFFSPGIVTAPYTIHSNDGVAIQAQIDLVAQYTDLDNRPATSNLTGRDLAGLTLAPGIYSYDTSAQLSGTLTLDAQNNPNAVFIINIGSTLVTGSASSVALVNGAQGGNVFFVVGSSATLGTDTTLTGQILALTSITLNTGADIVCGAALARNGAVTLDTNTISVCTVATAPIGTVVTPVPTTPVVPTTPGTPVVTPTPETPVVPPVPGTPVGETPVVTPVPGTPVVTPPVTGGTPVVTPVPGTPVVTPTTPPVVAVAPVRSSTRNERAVAFGIDNATGLGSRLPLVFSLLTPNQILDLLGDISGEVGTAVPEAGRQAMGAFLTQVFNRVSGDQGPFSDDRGPLGTGPSGPPRNSDDGKIPANERFDSAPGPTRTVRALGYGPGDAAPLRAMAMFEESEPEVSIVQPVSRPWNAWISGYGETTRTDGDSRTGAHDRSIDTAGFAGGIDYLVTPDTMVGFAVGAGSTEFGLSGGNGYGSSDVVQAAIYGRTNFDAAYLSATLAAGYNDISTERSITLGTIERFSADFSAWDIAGQVEAGYRFDAPDLGLPGAGWITPYAALQVQTFFLPSYSEDSASIFALDYDSDTSTSTRTELGVRFGRSVAVGEDAVLTLRSRIAWAHDEGNDAHSDVSFQSLPGSDFRVEGADADDDSLLASAGAQVGFGNGFAVGAFFDSKLSENSQSYSGTGRLSYAW